MKAVSAITPVLLIASVFVFAFGIPTAKSQAGTIYIRADGSIDPPNAPISTVDNVTYSFLGDINGSEYNDVVRVERSNIVLEGSNRTIHAKVGAAGVGLYGTINVTARNFNVDGGSIGIGLLNSSYCNVVDNNLTSSIGPYSIPYGAGVWLGDAASNNVIDRNIVSNRGSGIYLIGSNYNIVRNNSFTDNNEGLWFYEDCFNNTVVDNIIAANEVGISFFFPPISNNTIYHNDFLNNSVQVQFRGNFLDENVWDNGYPSGGNYWSNYSGSDLFSGPFQNLTGSDGIGDTPYIINAVNTDSYPIIPEFPTAFMIPMLMTLTLLATLFVRSRNAKRRAF